MALITLPSLPSLISPVLLMLAICAVWLPALPLRGRLRLPPWLVLLVLALAVALCNGQVNMVGVLGLLLLGVSAWRAGHARQGWATGIWLTPVIVLSLLLAMHRWPGFFNPLILPRQAVTPGALPFMLYANLDKGSAGLLLLALLAPRCHVSGQWQAALRRTLLPGALTIVAVMLSGWLLGMVRPEAKWPPFAASFLAINLLLTVVAEETFFRGLIQQRLQLALHTVRGGPLLALVASALLFGAAHLGGRAGLCGTGDHGRSGLRHRLPAQRPHRSRHRRALRAQRGAFPGLHLSRAGLIRRHPLRARSIAHATIAPRGERPREDAGPASGRGIRWRPAPPRPG